MNKISFLKKSFVLFGMFAALCVSCKQDEEKEEKVVPSWTVNPAGVQNLPAVVLDGSASNVTDVLKSALKSTDSTLTAKNLVVMYFDDLSDTLVNSTAAKYGDLIISDLPLKLTFTASSLDENTSKNKVPGYYLGENCYKAGSYATTGCFTNSVIRQFKSIAKESDDIYIKSSQLMIQNPRPVFVLAKDTDDRYARSFFAKSSPDYINEIYKSSSKYTENFEDAVSYYKNNSVLIEGVNESHPDEFLAPERVFNIMDPASEDFPSVTKIVWFSLAWTEYKSESDGFFFVMHDEGAGEDKESALKNFDDGVAVAVKYVLENPDTILLVTSSALDGSSVPAYIWGNVTDAAKNTTSLLDFVKTMFEEE